MANWPSASIVLLLSVVVASGVVDTLSDAPTGVHCGPKFPDGRYPYKCTGYYVCKGGEVSGSVVNCPNGRRFSFNLQRCVARRKVACIGEGEDLSRTKGKVNCTSTKVAGGSTVERKCGRSLSLKLDAASRVTGAKDLQWTITSSKLPCGVAEDIFSSYATNKNQKFKVQLQQNDTVKPYTFTVLSATRGGVTTGFDSSAKFEFELDTIVQEVSTVAGTYDGTKMLYVATAAGNLTDPATCAFNLAFNPFLAAVIKAGADGPFGYWKINLSNASVVRGSLTALQVGNVGQCAAGGVALGGSVVAGVLCVIGTFGACAPLAAGIIGVGVSGGIAVASGCPPSSCMPADALVQLASGTTKRMDELTIGDKVLTRDRASGVSVYSDVYLFGHQDPYTYSVFKSIHLAAGQVVELSPGHFIPVVTLSGGTSKLTMKRASDIQVADVVWYMQLNGTFATTAVSQVQDVKKWGLYNPFTMTGDLVANDVLVSAHSEWFLDEVMPHSYVHMLPGIYQKVMAPVRLAYSLGGAPAINYLVNNLHMVEIASKLKL